MFQGAGVDLCLLVHACMYVYVCALVSSVLVLMLRPMTHATTMAKRQPSHKLETTCCSGEQGEGKWLFLTSILTLIHYRLYMSKRLPSADSVERACDAFARLLSPKGSPALPSLAANSKHCYLEWCISLCLPARVDSPSPTQTQTHTYTHQQESLHTHAHNAHGC